MWLVYFIYFSILLDLVLDLDFQQWFDRDILTDVELDYKFLDYTKTTFFFEHSYCCKYGKILKVVKVELHIFCLWLRYLLEQDFPGMRIGPEPTTDGFIAVMYGENEGVVPGNALVVDPKKPFRKLNAFGNSFLNR